MTEHEVEREKATSRSIGWTSLALWAALGMGLELGHAFKLSSYLDHPLRRELLTWAHAHGVGLSLVVLAYAAVGATKTLPLGAGTRLRAASWLMPLGFLLSVLGHTESDPGPAIIAVPAGALLLLTSLAQISVSARRS